MSDGNDGSVGVPDEDSSASEPDEGGHTQSISGTRRLRRALALVPGVAIVAVLGIAVFAGYEALEARDDLHEANELIDQLEEQADMYVADADLLAEAAVALDGRVATLEGEVGGLTDVGGVASTVDDLNTRVANLESEVNGIGAPTGFGSRVDDLESDVGCLDRALRDVTFNWTRTSFFYFGC